MPTKTATMLYNLSDIAEKIEAQRTQELTKLEAEYKKAKAELVKHANSYQTARNTVCPGGDCRVQLVPTNAKSKDWNGLVALAKALGATDEQIAGMVSETPSWSVRTRKV